MYRAVYSGDSSAVGIAVLGHRTQPNNIAMVTTAPAWDALYTTAGRGLSPKHIIGSLSLSIKGLDIALGAGESRGRQRKQRVR